MKIINRQLVPEVASDVWTPDGISVVKPFLIVVMVSQQVAQALARTPNERRLAADARDQAIRLWDLGRAEY